MSRSSLDQETVRLATEQLGPKLGRLTEAVQGVRQLGLQAGLDTPGYIDAVTEKSGAYAELLAEIDQLDLVGRTIKVRRGRAFSHSPGGSQRFLPDTTDLAGFQGTVTGRGFREGSHEFFLILGAPNYGPIYRIAITECEFEIGPRA